MFIRGSRDRAAMAAIIGAVAVLIAMTAFGWYGRSFDGAPINGAIGLSSTTDGRLVVRSSVCWGTQQDVSVARVNGSGEYTEIAKFIPDENVDHDSEFDPLGASGRWHSAPSSIQVEDLTGRIAIGTLGANRPDGDRREWTELTELEFADWTAVAPGDVLVSDWSEGADDGPKSSIQSIPESEFHAWSCEHASTRHGAAAFLSNLF